MEKSGYLSKIKKTYGPYTRSDGRQHVCIILIDGSRLTRSYPKYLKELELGRELDVDLETIDHKDRDFSNDSPDNIQVMSRSDNSKKSVLRRKDTFDNCVWCEKYFELTISQVKNRCSNRAGPFCSRSCAGKYGAELQNGRQSPLGRNEIFVEYYRLDD